MEKEEALTSSPPQPPKYSRYRSVRNAATAATGLPVSSPQPLRSSSRDGVERSMSRYKKPRAATAPSHSEPMPILHKNALTQGLGSDSSGRRLGAAETVEIGSKIKRLKIEDGSEEDPAKPSLVNEAQQEAYNILNGKVRHARPSTRRENIGEEDSSGHGKRPGMSRTRTDPTYTSSGTTKADEASLVSDQPKIWTKKEPQALLPVTRLEPQPVPPAFDAPISAVNAGPRQVTVGFNERSVRIPVTPTSTPADIILSASNLLGGKIDPSSHILLESFKQVGLERPLRHYEHVRDVMNSWDQDDQNTLLVIPSSTEGKDDHLAIQSVSGEHPGETSVGIYHSQKPGTWDKRWVTLRSDGQVLVAKQSGAEGKNICHISDFDIYMPTTRQLKKLKPPRKYCFAIKSQQKSAMFLNTVNFVHFFATKDKEVAAAWYKAVQAWRSWYLVNEMGLGQDARSGKNYSSKVSQHQHKASTASTHHTRSGKLPYPEELSKAGEIVTSPVSIDSVKKGSPSRPFNSRGGPPVSYPKKLTKDSVTGAGTTRKRGESVIQIQHSRPSITEDPFLANGLLGQSYSQRQQALQAELDAQKDNPQSQIDNPKIKPLVEFSSLNRNPSGSRIRKGDGLAINHTPAGGLIDVVDNPEKLNIAPPAPTWRPSLDQQQSGTVRHKTAGKQDQTVEPAFTGGGLLAGADDGQGGRMQGKGVACGDRSATEPLLELERERAFA